MIITFAHYKGGTGKTTSCLSVAGHLARKGRRVLVVDLDPQANSSMGLRIDSRNLGRSMYHVLKDGINIKKIILKTHIKNLDIAPASLELGLINMVSYKSKTDAQILSKALSKVKNEYDFILLDTPPISGHFIINAMAAADRVVVVLDPGVFALKSLSIMKETFQDFFKNLDMDFDIDMALVTKVSNSFFDFLPWRKSYAKEIKKDVENILDRKVFMIPFSNHIYETHARGIPISHYKPRSRVARAYERVVDELIKLR